MSICQQTQTIGVPGYQVTLDCNRELNANGKHTGRHRASSGNAYWSGPSDQALAALCPGKLELCGVPCGCGGTQPSHYPIQKSGIEWDLADPTFLNTPTPSLQCQEWDGGPEDQP